MRKKRNIECSGHSRLTAEETNWVPLTMTRARVIHIIMLSITRDTLHQNLFKQVLQLRIKLKGLIMNVALKLLASVLLLASISLVVGEHLIHPRDSG